MSVFSWLRRKVCKNLTSAPSSIRRRMSSRLRLEALETRVVLTVTYHGGPLLNNVQVQALYYGSEWSTNSTAAQMEGQLEGYLQYIVNSPYMDMLTIAGYDVDRGSFTRGWYYGKTIDNTYYLEDSTIQTDLQYLIGHTGGGVAAPVSFRLYVVFVEPNVAVEQGLNGPNSQKTFSGYHGSFPGYNAAGQSAEINYAVVTVPGGTLGNKGWQGLSAFDSMTKTTSHELAEAVTDPEPFGYRGWYDPTYSGPTHEDEIGDIVENLPNSTVYLNGYAVQIEAAKNDQPLTPTKYTSRTTLTSPSS